MGRGFYLTQCATISVEVDLEREGVTLDTLQGLWPAARGMKSYNRLTHCWRLAARDEGCYGPYFSPSGPWYAGLNIFAPTFDQPASTTAPEGISTSLAGQVSTLPGEVQDVILHYLPPSVLIKLGLS